MVRRKHAEVHVNQERWLVSYADFITLLFAFFVVMYSISQVNQSKYRVLSETFEHAFNSRQITTDTTSSNPIEKIINPIQVGEPALSPDPSAIDVEQESAGDAASTSSGQLQEISALVNERFADLINDELVSVSSNELWLQIELKDSILFASGGTDLSLQAQAIFDEIAGILKGYSNPIQVEGYTDNIPINNPRYPSNWELSSARASAIVKLLAARGVAPQRLSAVGFGEFQPVASNEHPAGRAQNRRVALMIARRKIERPGAPVDQQLERAREMSSPAIVEPLRRVVEEKDNQAAQQGLD
ncbi:flagellar motor protein MotD [Cellvibrio sp. PSBB006]|uniref:flagellar motor protein MotD n=1 Tax=Cellvibrio sp. PSBB006 TaxID=1987723 RepID=UPI000B3B525D|nr:flagellar motor protein MotD [Cellvibrio sp. PSBB006]ARU26821.1 flagellar motor protein MotB [Cellvibrio sp. PSBB006]